MKRARVDMLTSCATVLRSIGYHLPDFVVGMGQGGLIVGLLRFPLMVEVTLQARNLQREEIKKGSVRLGRAESCVVGEPANVEGEA